MAIKSKLLPKDQFYILATTSAADASARILKRSNAFLITDRLGNIRPLGFEMHGLFDNGTRFLSNLSVKFENTTFLLLSSRITEKNNFLIVDLENPDCQDKHGNFIPKGLIHLYRSVFLWDGCYYERIRFTNYSLNTMQFLFSLEFDADFRDIFEIRGLKRKKRGKILQPILKDKCATLSYQGLDNIVRKTTFTFSEKPKNLTAEYAAFDMKLKASEIKDFYFNIACATSTTAVMAKTYDKAHIELQKSQEKKYHPKLCMAHAPNHNFNEWLARSHTDLFMMLTKTPYGVYPYAGIPWYNTVFGRDGIITAIQTIWLYPHIAKGVLTYLAKKQADHINTEQDAAPGKILHEVRHGEMANLKEVPFGLYYGTVDATPLFILLAGLYYEYTNDKPFIKRLWPHIEKALDWIDQYGDIDNDGFVEYASKSKDGLKNQGWKDSWDAIFHQNGSIAEGPIALCEVQGYVYLAKIKAATIASMLGKQKKSDALIKEAKTLQKKFITDFWCEELNTYAIALDGQKKQCKILSSNAGQCLFSGIASAEHAPLVIKTLMDKSSMTTWGIRTIASSQIRYNPMAYHNGSIWPHDNALIAFGMNRYGFKHETLHLMAALFEASTFMHLHRLPELYCGFQKPCAAAGPTLYSVACSPQSWASASIFMFIQACLGLTINAPRKQIHLNHPALPPFLEKLYLRNLQVENAFLDLSFTRCKETVAVDILRQEGHVDIVLTE
jgi:glycogen debranching enzyme